MKHDDLIRLNINNLTSLWEQASLYNNSFTETTRYNYSASQNRYWPNRLWFKDGVTDSETLSEIKKKILPDFPNLIIQQWDVLKTNSHALLEQNGFNILFEQIAMHLKLENMFTLNNELEAFLVSTKSDAFLWCKLFKLSFGYEIHPDVVINTQDKISYYIAKYNNTPVGTAMTYNTGETTGIHSVGISPEERRKGLANELMKVLINKAISNKSELVTLQASSMGKGLYIDLGFEEQCTIKNYYFPL